MVPAPAASTCARRAAPDLARVAPLRSAMMTIPEAPSGASAAAPPWQALAIHTQELTKVYAGADFAAVDRLSLDVQAGEIFGLLGPNGAGKTTTAGMLTTRVVPTSGRGFVGGVDIAAHPALVKQLSGIVSQQNTLDRQLSVWENLYFHGRLFGIGSKRSRLITDELLEQFQLTKWARASVYSLSGGMAQRLMVARAIFHRPAVLFLDEPTAGLDPQGRLALWEMLGKLNDQGQTILLTTHYNGGSRQALQPGRDHGPRSNPGTGHARRAQTERGCRHCCHGHDKRRSWAARRAAQKRGRWRHTYPVGGWGHPAPHEGQ